MIIIAISTVIDEITIIIVTNTLIKAHRLPPFQECSYIPCAPTIAI
jgi:hypothetical protein